MSVETNIDDIPTEILEFIFTFISAQDLYSSVTLVCERWHAIVTENFVRLKQLTMQFHEREIFGFFISNDLSFNEVNIKTARYLPYLESAEVYCNDEYHPPFVCRLNDMFQYLGKFNLTMKRLALNNFKRMPRTNIGLISKYFEYLECLKLVNCSTLRAVNYDDLSFLQNLTSLYLENCFDLNNSFLAHLGQECDKLTVLVISGARGITNCGLFKFLEFKKSSIQKLGFCCYGISDEGYRRLGQCSQLSVLYLEECRKLTWRGLDALALSNSIKLLVINKNASAMNEVSYWLEARKKNKITFEFYHDDGTNSPYVPTKGCEALNKFNLIEFDEPKIPYVIFE